MLGRATGVNGGRAGSMNIIDPDHACSAASGSSAAPSPLPRAPRLAPGTGGVAVAYFGDGAINQAYFFECLNFAT